MCEILVMIKTNNEKISKQELRPFLERCINSGVKNNDGFGVMCETWYMKSTLQFKKNNVDEIIKEYENDSRFFAVHTRLATCEVKKEFTHPFVNKRFMLMHNGVVSVDGKKSGSDSLDLFDAINDAFTHDYAQAIKESMKNISGSYSVLSFVMGDGALYYYRNNPSFDFMLCKDKNIIYGATDIDRLKSLQTRLLGFFETSIESRPLQNILYKIDLKNGRFSRVAKITEKEIKYQWMQENLKCDKPSAYGQYKSFNDFDSYGIYD